MNRTRLQLSIIALAIVAASGIAQISVANLASGAATPFLAAVGTGLTIDTVNPRIGVGCLDRAGPSAANASYLPCGFGLNPATGYTIQFWLRLSIGAGGVGAGNPDYLFGDGTAIAPATGAFRCFAGGAAGVGQFTVRGLSTNVVSIGAPLSTAATWTHIAMTYNPTTTTFTLYVNGVLNAAANQIGFTTTGSALTVAGYANSTTTAQAMKWDDIRIYGFARTAADIAADYTLAAAGNGPSGAANLPVRLYVQAEASAQPHYMNIGTNADPMDTGTRPCSGGTTIEWDPATPAGDIATSVLINIGGPTVGEPAIPAFQNAYGLPVAQAVPYSTFGVPGLQIGHALSTPANALGICWPDGLFLSNAIPGLFAFALAYPYTTTASPSTTFAIPPGVFQSGDSIHLQSMTPDLAYPLNLAMSNRATFVYNDCNIGNPGPHCHIEARGAGAIQVQAFWEIHNRGILDISSVTIDATTCVANGGTATGFAPGGFLNTGGTLSLGTSYRRNSPVYTGLQGLPTGYIGTLPLATAGTFGAITFNFNSFTACTDALLFDCDSVLTNINGNAYIGATVSVSFTGGPTLTGLLVADPGDPLAAVIDL